MARMHTRRHGKSKSRKPVLSEAEVPEIDRQKVEEQMLSYVKQGMGGAMIGQTMKDKHGAGHLRAILGKRLNQFLAEKGVKKDVPDDLMELMRKAILVRKHLAANHRDVHGKVRLQRVESKIWRLSKYYKASGKLPAGWKYDPVQAALMIKKA